jgi:succinoglycan biosynthesis transport protein ExoP
MTTTLDTGRDVSIDLRRALRWRWPVLFVAAIVGLVVGSFVAAQRPQEYEATAITAIVPARSDSIPGADYVSLAVPSFIAFATSPAKLQDIALAVGVDVGDLQSSVQVEVQGTSNTITVTARADSPSAATRAANSIAYEMTRFRDGSQVTRAVMVAAATTPDAPREGAAGLLRGAGLLGGIAVGIALVWMLERRRPHVARAADVVLATGSECLGALPRSASLRHGHPERSDDPTVEAASRVLVTELLARLPPGRRVVLVTAARRGAGTSTVAGVLASAAALVGRKVVLVRPVRQQGSDPGAASTSAVVPEAHDGVPTLVEVPLPVAQSGNRFENEGLPLALQEVVSDAIDRFDIVVIDAPPILEGRWRRDGAGLADGIVLVASAGDFVDRVRTAAVLASSLASLRLVAIGNRMPWSTPTGRPDELTVQGEESRAHPLFGVQGGGSESASD